MNQSHREAYPEQYSHPLVGKRVRVNTKNENKIEGTVTRVMSTQWGKLVDLGTSDDEGNPLAYGLWDCTEIEQLMDFFDRMVDAAHRHARPGDFMYFYDTVREHYMEEECSLRDDVVLVEVSHIYSAEELDDEGYPCKGSYLYEFRVFAYNELVHNYEIDVTDTLTDQENLDMQKHLDSVAADNAAAAAERRYD